MEGYPIYNAHAFTDAHAICKLAGAKHVYNPAQQWLCEPQSTSDKLTHKDYMHQCLNELINSESGITYDAIIQLHGWEKSSGAFTEYSVANALEICILSIDDILVPEQLQYLLENKDTTED